MWTRRIPIEQNCLFTRRVHRVVFVDFKNHLFRDDLGFFRTIYYTYTADLAARKHSKIVQSAPPARPCTSIVDVSHVHVQCSASMPIPYVYANAKSCLCTCTHAELRGLCAQAPEFGKTFDIFLHAQEPWKCSSSNNNLGTCSY